MKYIKKLVYVVAIIIMASVVKVNAATLNVNISSSSNKIVVGNTVTYTVTISSNSLLGSLRYNFSYDSDKLTLLSGTLNAAPYFDGVKKSATYTFKFKAKKSGTATVKFNIYEAIDWDLNNFSYNSSTSKTTTIITQEELVASYSKNNNLSNLKVDNYSISPAFNKNTTNYSLTVENDVREINISGSKEDSKSTVSGLGKHSLEEGDNKINIVVTAQNGSSKTYTLNVTVKELSPIVVKVNNEDLNVVRKKDLLQIPNSNYKETTIVISEEEVPALLNEVTNTTLVGLKDSEGNIKLYVYENNEYKLYKELSFDSIIVTESDDIEVPEGYVKTTIEIDNEKVTAYKEEGGTGDYYLLNAVNISNGEKHLYQYNRKENTIQIFNNSLLTKIGDLKQVNKNYAYVIIGLGALLVITYLVLLVASIKKGSKKKKSVKKEEKDSDLSSNIEKNEDFDKELDEKEENNDKIIEDISKKTKKKKK